MLYRNLAYPGRGIFGDGKPRCRYGEWTLISQASTAATARDSRSTTSGFSFQLLSGGKARTDVLGGDHWLLVTKGAPKKTAPS